MNYGSNSIKSGYGPSSTGHGTDLPQNEHSCSNRLRCHYESCGKDSSRGKEKIYNRVLFTQKEAQDTYGKSVINALVKRGFLQQYKFDTREAVDREGNPIIKAKGVIYYRIAEIEKAIEDGNILKGTRRGTI